MCESVLRDPGKCPNYVSSGFKRFLLPFQPALCTRYAARHRLGVRAGGFGHSGVPHGHPSTRSILLSNEDRSTRVHGGRDRVYVARSGIDADFPYLSEGGVRVLQSIIWSYADDAALAVPGRRGTGELGVCMVRKLLSQDWCWSVSLPQPAPWRRPDVQGVRTAPDHGARGRAPIRLTLR